MASSVVSLGPFDVLRPIASGDMGTVWRAVHREQQVPVAIKVLSPEFAGQAGADLAIEQLRAVGRPDEARAALRELGVGGGTRAPS